MVTRQTRRRIFAHDGSNDANSPRMCRLEVSLIFVPIYGININEISLYFGAWIGILSQIQKSYV